MLGLRFDIDSHYGLTKRLNPLLDLLSRHGLRASFFCVMGADANIAEIVRLRLLGTSKTKVPEKRTGANGAYGDGHRIRKIMHTLAYPRKVGSAHPDILRRLTEMGHEVYPHGWSHIQWQRNLDNIDIPDHLNRCIEAYSSIFSTKPAGFASPARCYNRAALEAFDKAGFSFVGDMDGDRPFYPGGRSCLQIPITWFVTIDELRFQGLSETQIVDAYAAHILGREFAVIYEHPDNLHGSELRILDRLFSVIRDNRVEVGTFSEICRKYGKVSAGEQ